MEKVSWTDSLRNEKALEGGEEERNVRHTVKRRKANWIVRTLRRNCLVKHVIGGKMGGQDGDDGETRKKT